MSVLIKGMKMPNNCGECVLCNAVKDDEYDCEINTYCHATSESLESLDVRGDWCPLVDVPTPHGRLVDCKTLKDDLAVLLERNEKLIDEWLANAIDDLIDELPTIIDRQAAIDAPSAQPSQDKYEYHYDHTDCIWYRPEARNRCPVTCAQYRDGWNDAMNYIFRNGNGYRPYRRDQQHGE